MTDDFFSIVGSFAALILAFCFLGFVGLILSWPVVLAIWLYNRHKAKNLYYVKVTDKDGRIIFDLVGVSCYNKDLLVSGVKALGHKAIATKQDKKYYAKTY